MTTTTATAITNTTVPTLECDTQLGVIPEPRSVQWGNHKLHLHHGEQAVVIDHSGSRRLAPAVARLRGDLDQYRVAGQPASHPLVTVSCRDGNHPSEEGYGLRVTETGITIEGNSVAGCFYGIQTLRQMLRLAKEDCAGGPLSLPGVVIEDAPRYAWRGMMVDSARNYQPLEFLKSLVDRLAHYKFNVMHWHLVDDQGWRLEIKSHPRLTAEASYWSMGDRSRGGYYTQAEIRELVAYAAQRFVRIVPEIEMPGHCTAVLTVYPELSCTGGPFALAGIQCIEHDIFCAGNDAVFRFLEDVLDEVVELFPDPYIHIGGDEAPKERWMACPRCQNRLRREGLADEDALQGWFIGQIHRYLKARDRRIIGWDDLGTKNLPADVAFQWWRNRTPDAWRWPSQWAAKGHQAIFSPTSHCYLDYSEDVISVAKLLTLQLTADHALIAPEQAHRLFLGGECNVWTEKIPWEAFNSRVFPRAYAFIEALWRANEQVDPEMFARRVRRH
jgi:hexosaminidase